MVEEVDGIVVVGEVLVVGEMLVAEVVALAMALSKTAVPWVRAAGKTSSWLHACRTEKSDEPHAVYHAVDGKVVVDVAESMARRRFRARGSTTPRSSKHVASPIAARRRARRVSQAAAVEAFCATWLVAVAVVVVVALALHADQEALPIPAGVEVVAAAKP